MLSFNEIASVPVRTRPAAFSDNVDLILKAEDKAASEGAKLVLTPALSLCAMGCEDLLLRPDFAQECLKALEKLASAHAGRSSLLGVGLPLRKGSRLYQAYVILKGDKVEALSLIKNDKIFSRGDNDKRYFEDEVESAGAFDLTGLKVAGSKVVTVDGLKIEFTASRAYVRENDALCVFLEHGGYFSDGPEDNHLSFLKDAVVRFSQGAAAMAVTPLGSAQGIIYDGACVSAEDGVFKASSAGLTFKDYDIVRQGTFVEPLPYYNELVRAVSMGLYDYLRDTKIPGCALSLSGGADSALCAVSVYNMARTLLIELGSKALCDFMALIHLPCKEYAGGDYHAYLKSEVMPKLLVTLYQGSENSSSITLSASNRLAAFLGSRHFVWSIAAVVGDYIKMYDDLDDGHKLNWDDDDITLQNIQARSRLPGIWLIANRYGKLVLETSNLSEGCVGYCTLDGDTAGCLAPICGINKSTVRRINKFLETEGLKNGKEIFLVTDIDEVNNQAPTAELRPGGQQRDEDDLMPYVILDRIHELFSACTFGMSEIYDDLKRTFPEHDAAYLKECLSRYLTLHERSQWKRQRFAFGFHVQSADVDTAVWHFPLVCNNLQYLKAQVEALS